MYYRNQKRILSDKEWMDSVMSQMIGDTKPIVEQAVAAAPSKTTTEFLGFMNTINAMFLKNKNAMPVDPNEVKALQTTLAALGTSIQTLQGEMKNAADAAAKAPVPAQPQAPGAAQAKAPVPGAPAPAAPAQGQPQAAQAPVAPAR